MKTTTTADSNHLISTPARVAAHRRGAQSPRGTPVGSLIQLVCLTMLMAMMGSKTFAASGEVFAGPTRVESFVLRNGAIVWQAGCSGAAAQQILGKPSAGGSVRTRYAPSACDLNRVWSKTVAVDAADEMFWIGSNGQILRKPSIAAAATGPSVLCSVEGTVGSDRQFITTSPTYVFWTETSGSAFTLAKIVGARKSDGGRFVVRDLSSVGGGAVKLHAVDDFHLVYLQIDGTLAMDRYVFLLGGGSRWERQVIDGGVSAFAVANSRIYYAAAVSSGTVELRSVSWSDLVTKTRHHSVSATGSPVVREIAADSANLYWQEARSHFGPIMRLSFATYGPAALTDNLGDTSPLWLESNGRYVFWMQDETTIRRIAVNSAAVVYDLAATGMEVIQAIQSPANDVPLVHGKATFVRLYGQIVSGDASVDGGLLARLHGEKDGVPLPGSPLDPVPDVGTSRLYNRPADRTRIDEGFLFRLPREWTTRGAITLRGELNPAHVINEANLANNSTSLTANFVPKAPICVIIHPLRTRLGVVGGSHLAASDPYFALAEAMLPTSDLDIRWPGGEPLEEVEACWCFPPWTYGPYELSQSDDDTGSVLMKLWWRNTFGDDPDDADALNARTHRACLFWPFSGQAVNGTSMAGDVLLAQLQLGGSGTTPDINNPLGAVTFAHELGHNYDRDHVNCPVGDPADPDSGYPYGCGISAGTASHLGFNPITRTLILPNAAGDLMSYAHRLSPPKPRWPSDYTWKGVFSQIDLMPSGRTPARAEATASEASVKDVNSSAQALVVGFVKTNSQAVLMNAVELPDAASAARALKRLNANEAKFGIYSLIARDLNGQILTSVPAAALQTSEGGVMLAAIFASDLAISKMELISSDLPNRVLAQLEGGGAAPVVNIGSPGAGAVVGATLPLSWTVTDPEGGPVRSTVRYSNNGGATWQVIAENTLATELAIPTAGLPGGLGTCLIQVLASDGLLTGQAVSAPFTLKLKSPQPRISFETAHGRSSAAVRVSAGEELILHGRAYDDEDGNLPDSALEWTLTGAANRTGANREWPLRDLRPGIYSATLTASDSSQRTSATTAAFTVEPRFAALATNAPVLDGYGDDAAYGQDHHPIALRYANSESAQVRMVYAGGALHVCVSGLRIGKNPRQRVALAFDPNHRGDDYPQPGDLRFSVFADGQLLGEHGNGNGFATDYMPTGAMARVSQTLDTWTAEFRIEAATLNGWNGQTIGLDVAHLDRDYTGDDTHWFAGDNDSGNWPAKWADLTLAADPNDPFDSDGDGLPDAWELRNFGTLARDGSGDYDNDGQSDASEFVSGTDAANAASVFRVTGMTVAASRVRITWPTLVDRSYTVLHSTDLRTFIPVRSDIAGTGGEVTAEFDVTDAQGFFRVQANVNR